MVKKIISFLISLILVISNITLGMAFDETVDVSSDIRFDFISDTENVLNTDPAVVDTLKAENGELVAAITKKDFSTSAYQIHFELPGTDLGDGGYYMYVKAKYQLPDGVQFDKRLCGWRSSLDQVWPGNSPATNGGWDGYQIIRYDIRELTGIQYLRLYFALKKASSSVTGVAEIDVDWVVLSKNSALDDTTAVINSISDGTSEITLSQDGDIDELTVSDATYKELSLGTYTEFPLGFSVALASDISDATYEVSITDKIDYKQMDIYAIAYKNGSLTSRSYRLCVYKEVSLDSFAQDIRFDFISDTENVLNTDSAVVDLLGAENGELVVGITKKDFSTGAHQIQFELPQQDLGDGGYYMYVKAKYRLPDGVQFDKRLCGWRSSLDQVWPANSPATFGGWDGYQIIRYDIRELTGIQYLRLYFALKKASSSVTGVAEVYVDWVVLSKNSAIDDTTSVITSISDGTNEITLSQDGSIDELTISDAMYNELSSGAYTEFPSGFNEVLENDISDVTYEVTVTDKIWYKLMDIYVIAYKNDLPISRSYRLCIYREPMPVALTQDIRFDFIVDTENVLNTDSTVVDTLKSENGSLIAAITKKDFSTTNYQIQFELPQVDLGDGGYYMYVKAKYDIPEGVGLQQVFYGSRTSLSTTWPATGGNQHITWDGYKILKFDISELTEQQYIRLYFWLKQASGSVTGVAEVDVDWIVLSKSENLSIEESVIDKLSISNVDYILPQDGDCLNLKLRTELYDSINTDSNELPEGWNINVNNENDYSVTVSKTDKYKIIDILVSNVRYCRMYRIIAELGELSMTTSNGSLVEIPNAFNIVEIDDNEYVCELHPQQYDLITSEDVIVSNLDVAKVINVDRNSEHVLITIYEGNQKIFELECFKKSTDVDINISSISFKNKKLYYSGNVSGMNAMTFETGKIVVAAFDETGINAKVISSTDIDEIGTFSGELDIPENSGVNEYYDMTIGFYIFGAEEKTYIKYYTETVLNQLVNSVKEVGSGNKIFTSVKNSEYLELFATMGIWVSSDINSDIVDAMLKNQIDEINLQNFSEIVNGTVVVAKVKENKTVNNLIDLLVLYENSTRKIGISTTVFSDLSESAQRIVAQHFLANNDSGKCDNWDDFENAVKESMLFYQIANTEDYKNVDSLILENSLIIVYPRETIAGTAIDDLKNNGNSADEIMKSLVNKQGEQLFTNSSSLLAALENAIKTVTQSNTGGNSSGGSSGSKGGTNGKTLVVGGVETSINTQTPPNDNDLEYADLAGYDWAKEAICYLDKMDVVNGTGNGNFEPNRNINREEFVKMVCEAFDFELTYEKSNFKDINSNDWYYPYVTTAVKLGVINGISQEEFGTGQPITREDMSSILYRVLILKGYNFGNEKVSFADLDEIAEYAKSAVLCLAQSGIVNGVGNDCFSPKSLSTRAEAAVVIFRSIQKI